MIRIFAKHMTDEKVIILCPRDCVALVQARLSTIYGGNWLLVDGLKVDEIIKFEDGQTYRGFEMDVDRYCSKIETLKL